MKKLLFSALATAALATTATAQLPDGSIAPDWTLTDINGNSHNLYSMTNAGYTVIIDMSATWCPPCWSYHQSGALEDVWVNHGPAGQPGVSPNTTDDVWVFYIEADNSTTSADLDGSGSNTQGDWITGVDYPIIDDASLNGPYALGYFPTIYTICPNRTLIESGQATATAHYANVGNCPSASGTNNGGLIGYNGETSSCAAIDVIVSLQNLGSANLTSATIEVFDGATSVASTNWTGNLATYDIEQVNVGSVTPTATTNYTIEITSTDDDASDNSITQQLSPAAQADDNLITVTIETDAYGSETTWELKDGTGAVVASGGPYNDLTAAGTTPQTPVSTTVTANDCMEFVIYDSYGDGIDAGYGAGSYSVTDAAGNVLASGGAFSDEESAKFLSGAATSVEEEVIEGLSVYPNPFNGVATVKFNNNSGAEASIEVVNMLGEVVINRNLGQVAGAQSIELDGTSLEAGIYMVNVRTGNAVSTTRVVLNK